MPKEPGTSRPDKQSVKTALRQLLHDIDAKRIHIRKLNRGSAIHVAFETDNGWKLWVFNDAGYWNYLDAVESPEGVVLDYDDMYAEDKIEDPQSADEWGILEYYKHDPLFPDKNNTPG